MQLTPRKVLLLIIGLGLPAAVAAGWALGQIRPAGTPGDGSGAMGTAPRQELPTPAARYDVYDGGPVAVPSASTPRAGATSPSPAPTTTVPAGPPSPSGVVPEEQTPSPAPTPPSPSPPPSPVTSR